MVKGLPPKKILVPKMICLPMGAYLTQFLTGRIHGQSLETFGHGFLRFNRETIEVYKKVQKLYKNSRLDRGGGGRTNAPPPQNTPLSEGAVSGLIYKVCVTKCSVSHCVCSALTLRSICRPTRCRLRVNYVKLGIGTVWFITAGAIDT